MNTNTDSEYFYNTLRDLFRSSGFNLIRRIRTEEYDSVVSPESRIPGLCPGSTSVILVGFAGHTFWSILKKFLNKNPGFRDSYEDWIDYYTVLRFMEIADLFEKHGLGWRAVFPFGEKSLALDFMKLGELGGTGTKGIIGVLIHPEYGPWISLRGAIISDIEFSRYDSPLSFNPCPECHKPCIPVCPANTVSEKGWDVPACMKFRLREIDCTDNCVSRRACPYGKEHQYTREQLGYHHAFVLKSIRGYF